MSAYSEYCEFMEYLKMPRQYREHKKHRLPLEYYTASDCEFFFTISAKWGQPRFTNEKLAQAVVDALLWRKRHHNWTLYVYCLMPDHLHFIVRLPPHEIRYFDGGARGIVPETILDHVGNFKKWTTTKIWWAQGGTGQLWLKSSYDRVIWYNRSVEPVCSYVLNNPVRKGLVEKWQDYPYVGIVDSW